jgi:hypothetical protein
MWDKEEFLVVPETDVEITLAPSGSTSSTISLPNTVSFPEMELISEEEEDRGEMIPIAAVASESSTDNVEESAGIGCCASNWAFWAALSALALMI